MFPTQQSLPILSAKILITFFHYYSCYLHLLLVIGAIKDVDN